MESASVCALQRKVGRSRQRDRALSVWTDFGDALRKAILMQERVDQLAVAVDRMTDRLQDHDRRLVRIETMIELAQRKPLPGGSAR